MENEVMTAEEAAAFLRINRKTIYTYAAWKRIPHQRIGRRIVFSRPALLQWLNSNVNEPKR